MQFEACYLERNIVESKNLGICFIVVGESLPLASFGILSGPRSLSLPKGRYPFDAGPHHLKVAMPT